MGPSEPERVGSGRIAGALSGMARDRECHCKSSHLRWLGWEYKDGDLDNLLEAWRPLLCMHTVRHS